MLLSFSVLIGIVLFFFFRDSNNMNAIPSRPSIGTTFSLALLNYFFIFILLGLFSPDLIQCPLLNFHLRLLSFAHLVIYSIVRYLFLPFLSWVQQTIISLFPPSFPFLSSLPPHTTLTLFLSFQISDPRWLSISSMHEHIQFHLGFCLIIFFFIVVYSWQEISLVNMY